MQLQLIDRQLFIKKLTVLIFGTLLFIPLVYFKQHGLAAVYIGSLLALHIFILHVYLTRTAWRRLLANKAEFIIRVVAVLFFIYLLSLLRFEGNLVFIVQNTLLGLVVHVGILSGLMVERVKAQT